MAAFVLSQQSMRYDITCPNGHRSEINKSMSAAYPVCSKCGGATRRVFTTVPIVTYNAAGFYSTDVTRFRNMVGPERFAQFEAKRDNIQRRAKAGRMTEYEKRVEAIA